MYIINILYDKAYFLRLELEKYTNSLGNSFETLTYHLSAKPP